MSDTRERLEQFKAREQSRHNEWAQRMEEQNAEFEKSRSQFQIQVLPYLRQARSRDYSDWLKGYMEAGGEPTYAHDYRLPSDFYVATAGFKMMPLYGAQSIHVIVPTGIEIDVSGGLGHCNLFFMDGFRCLGSWVPVYSDLEI